MSNESTAAVPQALPPSAQLLQLASGVFISQAIYVAAKLGVADLLANGPKTLNSLPKKPERMNVPSTVSCDRSQASEPLWKRVAKHFQILN